MNALWLIPLVSFAVLESLALLNSRDHFQPATYWIRRFLMLRDRAQPLWWLTGGLLAWLSFHFLVDA